MNLTASDIIAIIGALSAAVSAVIAAIANARAGRVLRATGEPPPDGKTTILNQNEGQFGKLDAIHKDLDAAKLKEEQVAAALAVAKALAEKK